MADDKSKIGGPDRSQVAGNQHHEVTFVADKFDISMEQARNLVERYGNNHAKLEKEAAKLREAGRMSGNNLKVDIAKEIYRALDDLYAPTELLTIVRSYGNSMPDADVLAYLKRFNETGTIFSKVMYRAEDSRRV